MSFKNKLGVLLLILGFVTLPFVRFGDEFFLVSALMITFGSVTIVRELRGKSGLRSFLGSVRRPFPPQSRAQPPRIDPLLPVRVLKVAESRSGVVTVSGVAMALNVGLDECQLALDELVRKGAANVDVDLANGVATYCFPEFQPRAVEEEKSK